MTVKLLTKPHLRFLSLKGGCTGSSESTLVKINHMSRLILCDPLKYSLPASDAAADNPGEGGGGTLNIFCCYVGLDPASTVYQ